MDALDDALRPRDRCGDGALLLVRHPHRAFADRDARRGRCRPGLAATSRFDSASIAATEFAAAELKAGLSAPVSSMTATAIAAERRRTAPITIKTRVGRRVRPGGAAGAASSSGSVSSGSNALRLGGHRSGVRRGRSEKLAVDRLGLGRGVGPELVGEEPSASLVHSECLCSVARGDVRLHQTPVSSLAKRLERDHLLGPLRRLPCIARTQAGIGQCAQRPAADIGQFTPLLVYPRPVLPRQERLTYE